MKKAIFYLLFLCMAYTVKAQLGTEFWFAPPNVSVYHDGILPNPPYDGGKPIYLFISAMDQPASVRIWIPATGAFDTTVNVAAFQSERIVLSSHEVQLETKPTNTVLNTGLNIISDNPITAFYEVSNSNNNEIFALKGANSLGTEFYIPMHKEPAFYNNHFNNAPADYAIASFDIVATQNATTVQIYSPVAVDGHAANTQFSITLNAGQTYSCGNSTLGTDPPGPSTNIYQYPLNHPAGAVVLSDKPIAITYKDDSDHDATGVAPNTCYDLIGDQIIPVDICGTDYIAVKGGLKNDGRESVILTATQNNTKVYLAGNPTAYATLFAGETYQIVIDSLATSTNNALYINATKPVYASHITGFGCELGSAILPPLNCAGSSRLSFVRSTNEGFFITLLVKTSAIGDFTITGSGTAAINPASFKIVPGTGGIWSAAMIDYSLVTQVPVDSTFTITNSSELFAMGLINGGSTTGCRYGYFSEFVARIFVDAGTDQTVCAGEDASLSGYVTGGATAGIWSTSGDGIFDDVNNLNASYTAGFNDILNGSVTLTLTSNSPCFPESDDLTLTITPAPTANAGSDISVCSNNPAVSLSGTVANALGGIWSGGSGTYNPGNTTLNATYTPTPAEVSAGTLTLTLTTTGNGSCDPSANNMIITFTASPTANPGPNQSVCANNPAVSLNGSVTIATGGIWTGGTGAFNPGNNALSCIYTPSPAEVSAGVVNLILTTTGNGNCSSVSSPLTINITPAPSVNAGGDQVKCSNNAVATLNGNITVASGGVWSGGLGLFSPDNTTLNATYTPNASEIATGFVNLTLTSTGNGNCSSEFDNVVISYTTSPTSNAGPDQTVCSNNPAVTLNGSVTIALGGIWSGGLGTFSPGNTTLNAVYTPTPAEISAGSLTLTLTTTNNGTCNPVSDQMIITFSPSPTVNAGVNQSLCGNNADATLNGTITVASGAIWSGGSGSFSPSNTALSCTYSPSSGEIAFGSVTLTLTTTGNGTCNAVSDQVTLSFTTPPTANAGLDQNKCANNAIASLTGSVSIATGGVWSGGMGLFNPNNTSLTTAYTPTAGEIASGFVNLTLTTTGNGNCSSVSNDIIITYSTAPTADAGIDRTVCANNPTVNLNGSVTIASGGTWSGGTGTFFPSANSLTALYTPSAGEISAGSVNLTLTTTGNGTCSPVSDVMTITITSAPIVSAGPNLNACINNSTATLAGSVLGATGGAWSGGGGTFNPSNLALNATYTPTGAELLSGSVTLTLTSTGNGNCNAVSDQMTINYTPEPVANAGPDQTKCSNNPGTTLAGSVSGATGGQWSGGLGLFNPNSQTLGAVYTPTAGEIAFGSITLTLTTTGNGNCNAVSDQMTIFFTPSPTADASTDQTVCANNPQVTLNGSISIATGGLWSGGTGTYSPANTNLNAVYTPSSSEITAGSVSLTLTTTGNGGCLSVNDNMVITINPAPIVNAGSNLVSCANNPTVSLSGSIQNAGGGVWSGGLGVFNPSNTALNATYTPTAAEISSGVVILTLTSTINGNCFAVSDNMTINITTAPTVNAGSDQVSCANNPNVNLVGSVIGATGGQWSGGLGQFLPNPNSLNVTYIPTQGEIAGGGITLTLSSSGNGSCNPVTDNVLITYTAAPTVDAGPDQVVCANNPTLTLAGNYSIAAGAIWSGGNGSYNPNSTTMNAVYTPGAAEIAAGFVTLTLTTTGNGNCVAVSDQITIFISPAPQVSAGLDITACQNNPNVTLNGIVLNAGGGIWSGGMGTFIPSNTVLNAQYIPAASEIAAGEVILTLTSTGNGSCLPSTDQVKITFNPSPIAFANIDQTVCANNNVVTLNGQISNAGGGLWSGGLGIFTPNNSILNATYTPSQTETNNGSATLILTTTGNGVCLAVSDTVIIHYTPAPVADAGIDFTVCNNNPVAQLNGNVTIASGGIWSGNGGSFVPDATSFNAQYIPTQSEILSGLFSLILTSTGNGTCNAVSDQVQIFITQAPLVVAGQDQTICVDALTVNLNGYIGGITTTGQWSSTGTGTFVPNPNALNASYLASSADSANGTVNLILTSTNNGLCNPVSDTLLVTILPAGYSNAGSDVTVCANNSVIFLNGQVSGGAASGYWTTTGSGVFVPNAQALNASYIPSSGDNAMGSVNLILTANSCNIAKDTLIITITPAPVVDAGNDITVCVDQLDIQLDGLVSGGTTTGIWVSSGTGTFSPDNTTFDAIYHASSQDSVSQHVTLVLLSTNNGNCFGVSDTMQINILPAGIVNAGFDQIYCSNNSNVQLNGQISGGASQGLWSTSGSGYFIPNATSLIATYVSSSSDTATGSVTLALVATDACNFAMDIIQINFSDAPIVNAGTDQTVCANNPLVNLSGSVSVAAGGIWSTSGTGTFLPDNVSLSAQYQPSQNDILNGNIDIILTSTGNGSCNSVKDTVTISFSPSPVVNAGINQSVCTSAGSTNLNGFVGSGASQGIWTTLGDGTFNPSNNIFAPEYIFGPSEISIGFVNLILTSSDNGNCNAVTDTMMITFGSSVFVFAGNDQQVCSTTSGVNLSGFVAGGSTTGIWTTSGSGSFNPGNTSLNAFYIFSSTDSLNGGADLILTSTNNGGCTAGIDTMHFTINYPSFVNTGTDMNICNTETVTLLSVSVTGGATAGIWTTSGDGVFTPSADILSPDYYFGTNDIAMGSTNIIFTTSDHGACPAAKDSLMIYFWEPNIVDAGNDQNICVTYPSVDLTGSVSGGTSTGIWSSNGTGSFVPGNTSLINSYIFSAADSINGSVELVLTSTGNPGCSAIADTVDIYLFPLPVINAGNNFSVCTGIDSISIAGTILNGTGGIWTTNGTGTFYPNDSALNAEYIPSQSDFLTGSVVLTLTSTGAMYCPNLSDNITITFTTPLIPAFSYTTPCLNGSVTFTDLTQILSGTISGWLWTFDGMNPDLNQNPDYVFNTSGIHNVNLTVTSSLGCSYSITNNVFVNPLPDVSFSFTTQCYFDSVSFTDLSTVSPGGINNWAWDFGDTTYSNSQNPVHYFSSPGTYAVSLTVVSDSTCSADVTLSVEVLSAPEAQYTFQYDCQNHNMSFTDQSDNNGNIISGWSWDFDNGSQDFTQNPLSHFTDTGSYNVQFIIFASQNCSDTIVQTVNIYDVEADFSFTNVCVYDSIIFIDNSEFNQGLVQQWEWDFGDDETSYVQNPAHLYQTSGDYNVTLIVVTADGCHDTITQTVSPKPVPVAGFNIVSEDYMVNKPVSFNDISTGANSYTWDFGDGTGISTNASSAYTYTISGTYEVFQAVMNEYNCVDTAFQNIIIIGDDEVYGPVLPTGFTPNGDGENDSLYVRGGPFKLLLFRIYNEWGQMIFETESPDLGWDGMRNGVLQPMGVYVYTVKATTITDKQYSISGEVTLIR